MFAESVNVGNKVSTDGEVAGAAEKRLCGVAEGDVAVEDFVQFILGESVQNT